MKPLDYRVQHYQTTTNPLYLLNEVIYQYMMIQHTPKSTYLLTLLWSLFLLLGGPATTAADSFPPLVPEGERLANNPAELETLFQTREAQLIQLPLVQMVKP